MPRGVPGGGRPSHGRRRAPKSAESRYWPLLAAIVVAAALLPTWRSIRYDFVWDDKVMIGQELDLRGPEDIARLWNTPYDSLLRDPVLQRTYFRPAILFSLAADRALSGANPAGFHRTNLAWYALACLLLWLLAWEISGRPIAATVGAALFALHPTHPESVCFIAGRTDVICGAFLFASLWAAARWGPRIRSDAMKLAPAAVLLLLALYSKEVALFASPLLLVILWVRERTLRPGAPALAAIPVLLADGIYWASRISVLGPHMLPAVSPVEGTVAQLLTSVAVVARYVPLLLFPVSLSARHEISQLRHPDWLFAAGIAVLVAAAVAFVWLLARRSKWVIPIALFASTLFPLCYVRIIAGALVAERFVFIPSGALAVAVSLLPGAAPLFLGGIAAPFFIALLLPRVTIWRDDGRLYASMLRDSPNSPYVHSVLGSYDYQRGDLAGAIEHHRRAFELKPDFTESLLNLSAAEDESGLIDSAFAHTRLLIRLKPDYAAAWYALGNLHVRVDQPDSAVQAYETALRLKPDFAHAWNNLGVVLERMGRTEEAIAHYKRAVKALPGYVQAANNLARLTGPGAK